MTSLPPAPLFGDLLPVTPSQPVLDFLVRRRSASALTLAAFLLQQKQYQEAMAVLEIPRYEPGRGDVLAGFNQMHRGVVFLENGKLDDARAAYDKVLASDDLK